MPGPWETRFAVGRYEVVMTFTPEKGIRADWHPDVPPPHSLTEGDVRQYKAARQAFLTEVSSDLGAPVVVVDV